MEELIDKLRERELFLEKMRARIEERQRTEPAGTLRISKSRGRVQFYHRETRSDRQGSYLRDGALAERLAQKDYDRKVLNVIKTEQDCLLQYLGVYESQTLEGVYPMLSEDRQKLVTPLVLPDELFVKEWMEKPYTGLGFAEDAPEYITDRGERVRSKSELIIANLLNRYHIPYRYEAPYELPGFGTVYPDYTVLNVRTRTTWYWEHQGMMDDPAYIERAVRKEQAYIRSGLLPGKGLILTSETQYTPLSVKVTEALIRAYLL